MRLALLVGSAYEKNGRVASIPSAEIDEGLIERRLCEADANFTVLRFAAERGLAERIEQRLVAQTEPISELLVYFSGYSVLSEERGPALLLDGERLGTLSLTRLRNLFLVHSASSCLIVDAAAVVDANQSLHEVADAIGTTLTNNAPSVSALVAVRNSAVQDSFGGSAFTGILLTTLDWLAASRDEAQAIDMGALYGALSADTATWKDIPAAGLFGEAPTGFTILPAVVAPSVPAPLTHGENPLPSFEKVAPLDDLLGLPTLRPEEPTIEPGLASFDAADEHTPTHPHAVIETALPSFSLGDSHDTHADGPLPSFGLDDGSEAHRVPLASEDGSGARLVSKASVLAVLEESSRSEAGLDDARDTLSNEDTFDHASADDRADTASIPEAEPSPATDDPDQVAVRELEAALARTRDTSERAALLARLARLLAKLGYGERASVLFVEAIQRDPLNIEVLMLRGEWAEAARDTENLMHTAEMWLAVAPDDVRALALLGKATERAGDARRSIDVRLRVAEHPDCTPDDRKRALRAAARLVRSELADFDWAERLDESARTGAALDTPESSQVAASETAESSHAAPEIPESSQVAASETAESSHAASETAESSHVAALPAEPLARLPLATEPFVDELTAPEAPAPAPDAVDSVFARSEASDAAAPPALVARPPNPEPLPAAEPHHIGEPFFPEPPRAEPARESGASQASGRETRRARARECEQAVLLSPEDAKLREELIELYRALDDSESALKHCRAIARFAPTHAEAYRLAHAVFSSEGNSDGAWNAASVLECLGEADINESLMVSQHRPEGLLAAQSTLSESEWNNVLFTSDRDPELAPLLAALGPSAAAIGTGFAKYKGRYRAPDPGTLQDPEKSTTMLAKTLSWTASMLGVKPPLLYIAADATRELEVVPTEAPSTVASRALGSGLGLNELAFLWGRHLARYRDEVKVLSFFASPAELVELLRAALALGGARGVDVRSLDGDEKRLYSALRRELRGPALERLQTIARGTSTRDLAPRAERELYAFELLGVRSGLAVCGDVCAAAELIQRFPASFWAPVPAQLGELYAFAISREYASLRRRLGVAVAA